MREKRRFEKIPLPPKEYMQLVNGAGFDDISVESLFKKVGQEILEGLRNRDMLRASDRVLDVGCGCGRFARQLLMEPIKSYTGFDRHPGMIEWCRKNIQSLAPNFEFLFFDIKSSYANIDGFHGAINAASFRFPFADDSFDVALLASVFTHMPFEESRNYLRELHRVLSEGGRMLLSVFFTNGEPYAENANFYYRPQLFWDMVRKTGFQYEFQNEVHYEKSYHNWHLLKKP